MTINRVVLKPEYTLDDVQERVALFCESVKTYHSTEQAEAARLAKEQAA